MNLKQIKITLLVVFGLFILKCQAQPDKQNQKLFLFIDREYCVSGDTLWFKVDLSKELEQKSNIVHVQLDSKDNNLIAEAVKKSNNGWAEGYLPVPDSLSTGIYFLTAFQNSQSTNGGNGAESQPVIVYNRFAENVVKMDVPTEINEKDSPKDFSNKINLNLGKSVFSPREKVAVKLNFNGLKDNELSNVVVKASQVDELASEMAGRYSFAFDSENTSIPLFDEKDGLLINGRITGKDDGEPKGKKIVLISVIGEKPYFDYYVTGNQGDFHFFLKNAVGTATLILQTIPENDGEEMNIELHRSYLRRQNEIPFETKILTNKQTEFISNALIGNYYKILFNGNFNVGESKFEMPQRFSIPFYGNTDTHVVLSDYIGLPNFEEIARELLPGVQYREKDGDVSIKLMNFDEGDFFNNEPLRLLNGIPVFKSSMFTSFSSDDINYINVVNKKRVFGDLIFNGVLSLRLNDTTNDWIAMQPNLIRANVQCLQPDSNPGYIGKRVLEENNPDIRQVYYWSILNTDEPKEIEFYLSDLKGKIEISVEGVTNTNEAVKVSKLIEVK